MTYEVYLAHHGVKGQRWGVRRYQNEDGTYTEEGERRYAKAVRKGEKLARKYEKKAEKAEKALSKADKYTTGRHFFASKSSLEAKSDKLYRKLEKKSLRSNHSLEKAASFFTKKLDEFSEAGIYDEDIDYFAEIGASVLAAKQASDSRRQSEAADYWRDSSRSRR